VSTRNEKNEKAAAKRKTDSAALRESLIFKLKISTKFSKSPNLFPTATPK
jgi:hypothetical protein